MPETESLADQSLWTRIEGSPYALLVKSARSGKTYRVEYIGNDRTVCNCPAGLRGVYCWHASSYDQCFLPGLQAAMGETVDHEDYDEPEVDEPADPTPLELADAEYNQRRAEWLELTTRLQKARGEADHSLQEIGRYRKMGDLLTVESWRQLNDVHTAKVVTLTQQVAAANARMADAKARVDALKPVEDTSYLAIDRDF